jgi:hypothetical protein
MSFGSKTSTPTAQPQTPVPQNDDPKLLDTQRAAALKAQNREGYNAHLLSGSGQDTTMESANSANLMR